jgi:hypothetical protein
MSTTRARLALADCEHALADFEAGANSVFRRSRWVAVMTLLRTVGYVLYQVDRPLANDAIQQRIDADWERLRKAARPHIFHDFIKAERGDVVHLYEVRAAVKITAVFNAPSGSYPAVTFDHFMRDGPFKARDPLDLCREAIDFWRTYLDAIDEPTLKADDDGEEEDTDPR